MVKFFAELNQNLIPELHLESCDNILSCLRFLSSLIFTTSTKLHYTFLFFTTDLSHQFNSTKILRKTLIIQVVPNLQLFYIIPNLLAFTKVWITPKDTAYLVSLFCELFHRQLKLSPPFLFLIPCI